MFVYSSFSSGKLPLGGLGYFFCLYGYTGNNVFVTVIEKKLYVLLLFTRGLFAVFGFSRHSMLHATLLKSANVNFVSMSFFEQYLLSTHTKRVSLLL